jgi:hypothetical protein
MREIDTIGKQDFKWADMGDFIVSGGDLADTRELQGLGFMEEVQRRIATGFGDWKLKEDQGANLHLYKDRINNKETWKDITDSISFSLTHDFFIGPVDFQVYVAPVGINEVAVRVEFSDNVKELLDQRLHNIKIVYNLIGEGPFIMR